MDDGIYMLIIDFFYYNYMWFDYSLKLCVCRFCKITAFSRMKKQFMYDNCYSDSFKIWFFYPNLSNALKYTISHYYSDNLLLNSSWKSERAEDEEDRTRSSGFNYSILGIWKIYLRPFSFKPESGSFCGGTIKEFNALPKVYENAKD